MTTPMLALALAVGNEAFEMFFALLALLALSGSLSIVALRLAARRSAWAHGMLAALSPLALAVPATVSTVSMLGSLYFSEIVGYVPCTLCWYQRICMYSLAVVLTVAAVRRDRSIVWYALPLAAIGAAIAAYHWLLERMPQIDTGACSAEVPCSFVWFEVFGFVSLPFMAFSAFVTTVVFTTLPPAGTSRDPGSGNQTSPQGGPQ